MNDDFGGRNRLSCYHSLSGNTSRAASALSLDVRAFISDARDHSSHRARYILRPMRKA